MYKVVGKQWRICCDNCKKPVGVLAGRREDRLMDPRAGYVLGVGKRTGVIMCGSYRRGCEGVIEHPVACSDACEGRLLETWPRVWSSDVRADDWEDDFRDADR